MTAPRAHRTQTIKGYESKAELECGECCRDVCGFGGRVGLCRSSGCRGGLGVTDCIISGADWRGGARMQPVLHVIGTCPPAFLVGSCIADEPVSFPPQSVMYKFAML